MTKLTLIRAGGLLGKPLSASKTIRVDETKLLQELAHLKVEKNKVARDNLSYTIVVNDNHAFVIARDQLEGKLLAHITQLEDQLKA